MSNIMVHPTSAMLSTSTKSVIARLFILVTVLLKQPKIVQKLLNIDYDNDTFQATPSSLM